MRVVLVGDFNENYARDQVISTHLEQYGLQQHVDQPTTDHGSVLDRVYCNTTELDVHFA